VASSWLICSGPDLGGAAVVAHYTCQCAVREPGAGHLDGHPGLESCLSGVPSTSPAGCAVGWSRWLLRFGVDGFGILSGGGDDLGDAVQFAVRVLGGLVHPVECGLGGDAVAFHQDALGLSDGVAVGEGVEEVLVLQGGGGEGGDQRGCGVVVSVDEGVWAV
jgi:hypothetical protein